MQEEVRRTDILKIAARYSEAYEWAISLDVIRPHSRFEKYEKWLSHFCDAQNEGQGHEFISSPEGANFAHRVTDIYDLCRIYEGLNSIAEIWIVDKLRDFCAGPEFAFDEISSAANRARNTGFELILMALFNRAGYKPIQKSVTDVVFQDGALEYHVECKRPQAAEKIDDNLQKCLSQIKKRLKEKFNAERQGLFAICLDKVLLNKNQILTVGSESEIEVLFKRITEVFRVKNRERYTKFADKRLVGGVVWIACPILIEDTGMIINAEWLTLARIADSPNEWNNIIEVGTRLQSVMHAH
jgi:hypothetical protein